MSKLTALAGKPPVRRSESFNPDKLTELEDGFPLSSQPSGEVQPPVLGAPSARDVLTGMPPNASDRAAIEALTASFTASRPGALKYRRGAPCATSSLVFDPITRDHIQRMAEGRFQADVVREAAEWALANAERNHLLAAHTRMEQVRKAQGSDSGRLVANKLSVQIPQPLFKRIVQMGGKDLKPKAVLEAATFLFLEVKGPR